MTFFLNNSGINVNLPFISNFEILWDGHSYLLYLFPIVEGRHYNGSDEDLKNVSRVVARMHKVLRSFKFNNIVFANALKTADRLAAVKEMLVRHLDKDDFSIFYERSDWTKRNHLWLRNMARNFNPYLCKKTGSQCIHGELHLGNVIFSLKDGGVILTDFEETVDSWLPPSFDLAYLVHRFCMDGIDSKLIFQKKLKILKKYYGKLPSNLEEISHQVCWYNVTLLIDKSVRRKSIVSEEEYDKFMNLEDKTTFLFS